MTIVAPRRKGLPDWLDEAERLLADALERREQPVEVPPGWAVAYFDDPPDDMVLSNCENGVLTIQPGERWTSSWIRYGFEEWL